MTKDISPLEDLAKAIIPVAQRAGAAILTIAQSDPHPRYKADRSPVTDADHAAEDIILEALAKLVPGVPAVAEERMASGDEPDIKSDFFVVDPLDGTKEFLKGNGEYTVNVALVRGDKPVFGLVYAPEKADCYVTLGGGKAARLRLPAAHNPPARPETEFEILTGEPKAGRPMTAIVSRSHVTPETEAFLKKLGEPQIDILGSSLKFGVIARGDADVYPRFGRTCEWDTAAGHALVNATGGCILTMDGGPFLYGKKSQGFVNPPFVAWRRKPERLAG